MLKVLHDVSQGLFTLTLVFHYMTLGLSNNANSLAALFNFMFLNLTISLW